MYGNNLAGAAKQAHPDTNAMPASACDEAYARLRIEQECADEAFARLAARLGMVLRDETPMIGDSACQPEENPRSEMHGRFLAAGDRARDLASRIDAITDRLTV